jgi:hypothetical protein
MARVHSNNQRETTIMQFFLGRPEQKPGRKTKSLIRYTKKAKDNSEAMTRTIGGGYRSSLSRHAGTRRLLQEEISPCFERTSDLSWSSSRLVNHHKHTPLFVKLLRRTLTREGSDGTRRVKPANVDEIAELDQVIAKDRRLPGTWYYSSNHILVNKERIKHNIHALTRRIELDALARERAEKMANECTIQHSDPEDIKTRLHPCRRFGENVASGSSIRDIHKGMIRNDADRNNMLDRRYSYFGMGTAKGEDGTLYLCQLFKG